MAQEEKGGNHDRHKHRYRRPRRHLIGYEDLLSQPERITKEGLKQLIDEGKNPLILDVRDMDDYLESDIKIKGSVRNSPAEIHSLIDKIPQDKPIIIY